MTVPTALICNKPDRRMWESLVVSWRHAPWFWLSAPLSGRSITSYSYIVVVNYLNRTVISSRVHTWISKPIPIRITLIRITFHDMESYFKHESRLPIWQPFKSRLNGSASKSIHIMRFNVDSDRKWLRYSGVDTTKNWIGSKNGRIYVLWVLVFPLSHCMLFVQWSVAEPDYYFFLRGGGGMENTV